MKRFKAILLFITLLIPQSGQAANYDISSVGGLTLACQNILDAEAGKKYDDRSYGLCFGYIRGVKNSYDIRRKAGAGAGGNICAPSNITWLAYIKSFVNWSRKNPKMQNKMAWTGVVKSLSETYPCSN